MTAFTWYFNRKYKRQGHLFQDRFKAINIDADPYLWHISRYIHLNPGHGYRSYEFSSYPYYVRKRQAKWVKPKRVLAMHKQHNQPYREFVSDWQDYQRSLPELYPQRADL